jgi:hypothetical protein
MSKGGRNDEERIPWRTGLDYRFCHYARRGDKSEQLPLGLQPVLGDDPCGPPDLDVDDLRRTSFCLRDFLRRKEMRMKSADACANEGSRRFKFRPSPPSSPSPFTIRPKMIEICAYAVNFAWLVTAENAPNRGFGRFAADFIRRNQIRGRDENGSHHLEFVDRRTSPTHCTASGTGLLSKQKRR